MKKEKIIKLLIKLQDSGGEKGSNNEPEAIEVFAQVEDQILDLISQTIQSVIEEIKLKRYKQSGKGYDFRTGKLTRSKTIEKTPLELIQDLQKLKQEIKKRYL